MKIDRVEIEQAENGFIVYTRWQELTNRYVARDWEEAKELLTRLEWVKAQPESHAVPTTAEGMRLHP